MKITCDIIKDILPLYVDNVVSDDTKELVENHLINCRACTIEAENMGKTITIPTDNDKNQIKKIKKQLTKRQIITIFVTSLLTLLILGGGFTYAFVIGHPVTYGEVSEITEFQYSDSSYLNQEWVIHFKLLSGTPLNIIRKPVYTENEDGDKILSGIVMYPLEIPIKAIHECDNYTWGYSYYGDEMPGDDFDFTVAIVYRDRTVTYSMRSEGLFKKQEIVKYFSDTPDMP